MKKAWNVYQHKDGTRITVAPNSQQDIILSELRNDCKLLYQITEEGEEPKKEVEKVVKNMSYTYLTCEHELRLYLTLPLYAYDFELHYKTKE